MAELPRPPSLNLLQCSQFYSEVSLPTAVVWIKPVLLILTKCPVQTFPLTAEESTPHADCPADGHAWSWLPTWSMPSFWQVRWVSLFISISWGTSEGWLVPHSFSNLLQCLWFEPLMNSCIWTQLFMLLPTQCFYLLVYSIPQTLTGYCLCTQQFIHIISFNTYGPILGGRYSIFIFIMKISNIYKNVENSKLPCILITQLH